MKDYKGKQKTPGAMLKGCSYAKGGKVSKVDKTVRVEKAKSKNTNAEDEKEIGRVGGEAPKERMDQFKRGGATKKNKTQVNVIVGAKEKEPVPVPVPVRGMKKGGKIEGTMGPKMDAGAGSGLGRLGKSKLAAKDKKKK